MKRILVLGGTQFVGRNLVETLLTLPNCDLTLFNRGKTNPHLFPQVKRLFGDRQVFSDLDKIGQQDWDIVFDCSAYFPIPLDHLLNQLKGKVGRYIYISTASIYDFDQITNEWIDERCPIVPCSEQEKTNAEAWSYNARKAECERVVRSKDWLPYLIFRPGLIIGPHDPTDRLYYWFYKVQKRFAFLMPDGGQYQLSFTDVTDLVRIMVQSMDIQQEREVYNTSSYVSSIRAFVRGAMQVLKKRPNLIYVNAAFLDRHQVARWTGLPLWVDEDVLKLDPTHLRLDFEFEPSTLEMTIAKLVTYYRNILAWREPGQDLKTFNALTQARENELIQALRFSN
ncbi:MAG: NAD-dependent epimerase/dehydratase family protein [Bacteroidota bacterium]